MDGPQAPRSTWLEKLGLHRPELRAWVLYDWANSALITTVITAIYPIYFKQFASEGLAPEDATSNHALATVIALTLVAVLAPILGVIGDLRACKKRLLGIFAGIGISATACMFLVDQGDWKLGMILFVVANIGASGSFVFYDALLPHVAREDEVDRVSTMGYAAGYLGGGIMLLLNIAVIENPEWVGLEEGTLPFRLAFVSVAVWWGVFSIPILLRVKEPPTVLDEDESPRDKVFSQAISRLAETFQELKRYRHASVLLIAFLIYNDGIQTIYRMATVIGADKGFDMGVMIKAIALVQFVGIPFAILFGQLAHKFGAKPMVLAGLVIYGGITIFGYSMETENEFIVLAVLVGMVQGGCQALSRSLFASMIPPSKSGEFFALFAIGEKFAGIVGPFLFWISIELTDSSQSALLSVLVFFLVGGYILSRVDIEAGRRAVAEPNEGQV